MLEGYERYHIPIDDHLAEAIWREVVDQMESQVEKLRNVVPRGTPENLVRNIA